MDFESDLCGFVFRFLGFEFGEQLSFEAGKSSTKLWVWTLGLSDQSLGIVLGFYFRFRLGLVMCMHWYEFEIVCFGSWVLIFGF